MNPAQRSKSKWELEEFSLSTEQVHQSGGMGLPSTHNMSRLCPRQHVVCVQNSCSLCVASRKLPQTSHHFFCLHVRLSVLPDLCLCHFYPCLLCDTPRPVCLSSLPSHTFHLSVCMSFMLCPSLRFPLIPLSLPSMPAHLVLCLPSSTLHPSLVLTASTLLSHPDCPVPGPDLEINPTLESLCLSMTEHALGGEHFLFP